MKKKFQVGFTVEGVEDESHAFRAVRESLLYSGLKFTTPQVTRMRSKAGWVVASPAGYLQDRGNLLVPGHPYCGPGQFDKRDSAYIFDTKKDAEKAAFGLLGPGRGAKAEKAFSS